MEELERHVDDLWQSHLAEGGSPRFLHRFGFVSSHPAFLQLLDCPRTLPLVVDLLGWNIYVYHSHLDVHPPVESTELRLDWHRDGGRMNEDLASTNPPRLSVKAAFFLTDVTTPESGQMYVIPGSHRAGGTKLSPDVAERAEAVSVSAGSALLFDRRLWHSRSPNRSSSTRKALFLSYSYRWVRPRDDQDPSPALADGLDPIRRQLLGFATSQRSFHVPDEADVPVRQHALNVVPGSR